ncbi:hypothetical protein [Eubacterium sp.]|uniref:hypothetical protein n=1 Tax=Eubacterium sp. TaxID=142586 RepID=UPI002FCA9A93
MTSINRLRKKIDQIKVRQQLLAFSPAWVERTKAGGKWEWWFTIGKVDKQGRGCDIEHVKGECDTRKEAELAVEEALRGYKPAYGGEITVLIDDIEFWDANP